MEGIGAAVLAVVLLMSLGHPGTPVVLQEARIKEVARQNSGDLFIAEGDGCGLEACVGLSSGTAGPARDPRGGSCDCQCHSHLPAFREDLQICVDDIRECALSPFVSGSTSQQIPFVYLPLKEQIIHPSREISFEGIQTPVCAVSGAKFLTGGGWIELRNPVDTDVPFTLFRDEGRTFLYWVGENDLRARMKGRLVLVHLMCREIANGERAVSEIPTVFTPCVAFRVAGTSSKYPSNVSEVVFAPDSSSSSSSGTGLTLSEYVAIGICSILLGLIYVASVFLYLHLRRRRKESDEMLERREKQSLAVVEEGVIKNNPLIGMSRHFGGGGGIENSFTDSSNSDTDAAPDIIQHHDDRKKNITVTSALVHPQHFFSNHLQIQHSQQQPFQLHGLQVLQENMEKLPEENVSIIETLEGREDRPDGLKSMGSTRKKLYFNPAYFDPQLLVAPPPAAIEFLTKIREVIALAKQKMVTKRFTPSLNKIPEEDVTQDQVKTGSAFGSRRSSAISLKRENSRRKTCTGCPGCEPQDYKNSLGTGKLPDFSGLVACHNCAESKQRSIRKWLEDVPMSNGAEKEDVKKLRSHWLEKDDKDDVASSVGSGCKRRHANAKENDKKKQWLEGEMKNKSTWMDLEDGKVVSNDEVKNRKWAENARSKEEADRLMMKKVVKATWQEDVAIQSTPVENNITPIIKTRALNTSERSLSPGRSTHSCGSSKKSTASTVKSYKKAKAPVPPRIIAGSENLSYPDMIPDKEVPTMTKKMKEVINEFNSKKTFNGKKRSLLKDLDYDTDSLERSREEELLLSGSSSQPSPSLSAALPMDEEMTMQNAIINTKTGNMTISKINMREVLESAEDDYEVIVLKKKLPEILSNYSLVSEVYVNNGYNYGSAPSSDAASNSSTLERVPKIIYNNPGHLLIEVEDCPDNYIKVEDSDSYEPDTLDRPKMKLVKDEFIDSLERPNQILLRSSGSFTNTTSAAKEEQFGSLREIYEAKNKRQSILVEDAEGRFLTLEERHHKRQRTNVPPDVIPPQPEPPIYEQPKPPRKVVKPPLPPKQNQKLDISILKNFIQTDDVIFKNHNNHIVLQATAITQNNPFNNKKNVEDSGYLSTDSSASNVPRKKVCRNCDKLSVNSDETDESLGDGQSESGGESVETHSVFFGSYRKNGGRDDAGGGGNARGSVDSGVGGDVSKSVGGNKEK